MSYFMKKYNMKNFLCLILFCVFNLMMNAQSTTIIDPSVSTNPNGSFENATSTLAANGWTAVNDGNNYWVVGTTTFNSGAKSAYISTNGTNNNYNKSSARVSHFYRDVTFPAGQTCITLSFNWKGRGEVGYDFLKVYLIPTSTTPIAGSQLSATNQLGTEYSNQNTWQTATIIIPASYAGTTQRLVFSWRNDNNTGNNPPAAVDNISLISDTPPSSTAPFTTNFETTCTGWNIVNGSETNQWTLGTATNNGGTRSMYVSNDGGASNNYVNTTSVTHFYRDVTFPAGQTCINLSFDWKGRGEVGYDFLKVYLVPTSTTPVAGTQLSAANQLGTEYSNQSTWQTQNLTIPGTNAGTTQRLVFSWRNDWSIDYQPPAAVDNIAINTSTPTAPSCATYVAPVNGATTCPSQTLSWNAATASCGSITYDVYFNSGTTATTLVSAGQAGTTYNTGALTNGTYAWRIVPKTGTLTASGCSTYTFSVNGVSNDLPCNATSITLGNVASGDNSCSSNAGEPGTPGCWTGGTRNTVWYSFVAPASGSVKIRTAAGTLVTTQIALYSGTCGVGMTELACNTNAPACGGTSLSTSEITRTGLTAGNTYYIAVDGKNNNTGSFAITVVEGSSSYPSESGQSCGSSIAVCNSTLSVGNPGYQGIGFTCDNDGTGNCTGGERGSVWYTFNIQNNGNLNFIIKANDYNAGSPGAETDYDFILWKIGGSGATNCAGIASGAAPVKCNYGSDGVTGLSSTGNAPPPYSSVFNDDFETQLAVTAGDVYLLLVNNYSNSTSGFSLDFTNTAAGVINYSPPTSIVWTGGANSTSWTNSTNWGGCTTPACGINAAISTGSSYQPVVTAAMGTVIVNNFTIDPGASLTLNAGATLKVCGNFTNNGTINADPTSTIIFNDDATHNLNGTLSGASALGNVIITDVAGGTNCTINANSAIEIKGTLTISNATSILNLNNNNLTLGGNLINASGANTILNITGSTLTFNGSGAQVYNPNNLSATPSLTLGSVVMNNSGAGVTISTTNTPNMILGTSGVLTLTSGKIITPGNQEVVVTNTSPAAVSTGNTNSFVQGNLRRYLAAGATGSFDFPVGHATPGYERANVNFTSAAAAGAINLLARFDTWGGAWPMPGAPNWNECSTVYNDPYLNNGYWTINASAVSTGSYNLTLYNTGYTTSSVGFSIAKSPSASPAWAISGNCVASPVTAVVRNAMSGFSKFATIQGSTPLPVQLISFTGNNENTYNLIEWKTAVEENFRHYELESSADGINFKQIKIVNPIGNPTSINTYEYLDFDFYRPITYYRLKMVDLDYTYKYSSIISIDNTSKNKPTVLVYPNPANADLYINVSGTNDEIIHIQVTDIYGRLVYTNEVNLLQNGNNVYLNTSDFATGTYLITVSNNESIHENVKVIINHNK